MKSDFMPIIIMMAVISIIGVIWLNYNEPYQSPVVLEDTESNTITVSMPFDECRNSISQETFDKVGTKSRIIVVKDDDSIKSIKVCREKDAVIVTCSAKESTRLTVENENTQGC